MKRNPNSELHYAQEFIDGQAQPKHKAPKGVDRYLPKSIASGSVEDALAQEARRRRIDLLKDAREIRDALGFGSVDEAVDWMLAEGGFA